MSAVLQSVDTDNRPARAALRATLALIASQRDPIPALAAKLVPIDAILQRAADAAAAVADLERQRDDIEVRRLVGGPVDTSALAGIEKRILEAQRKAEEAEREARPARLASQQLRGEIEALQRTEIAETNRIPLLVHAALIEEAQSPENYERLRTAAASFAAAWSQFMVPFFASDILAQQRPDLGLTQRTAHMRRQFTVPTPDAPGFEREGYIAIDIGAERAAAALLAQMSAGVDTA